MINIKEFISENRLIIEKYKDIQSNSKQVYTNPKNNKKFKLVSATLIQSIKDKIPVPFDKPYLPKLTLQLREKNINDQAFASILNKLSKMKALYKPETLELRDYCFETSSPYGNINDAISKLEYSSIYKNIQDILILEKVQMISDILELINKNINSKQQPLISFDNVRALLGAYNTERLSAMIAIFELTSKKVNMQSLQEAMATILRDTNPNAFLMLLPYKSGYSDELIGGVSKQLFQLNGPARTQCSKLLNKFNVLNAKSLESLLNKIYLFDKPTDRKRIVNISPLYQFLKEAPGSTWRQFSDWLQKQKVSKEVFPAFETFKTQNGINDDTTLNLYVFGCRVDVTGSSFDYVACPP